MSDPFSDPNTKIIAGPSSTDGTAFQRYFSQPMERGVAGFVQREFGTSPFQIRDPRQPIQPGSVARGVASAVTPQTPTGLAVDVATLLMPEVGLPARLGIAGVAGAIGGAFEGHPVAGALKGAGAQAGGELVSGLTGRVGRYFGENKFLNQRAGELRDFLRDKLPFLSNAPMSDLATKDLAKDFRFGFAKEQAGKLLRGAKASVAGDVKGLTFNMPEVQPDGINVVWVRRPFEEADNNITTLNRMGYGASGPRGTVMGPDYRQLARQARTSLLKELAAVPGNGKSLATTWATARRQFDLSKDLTDLFRENDVFLPNNQLNLPKIKDLVQRIYVDDFRGNLGPLDASNFERVLGGGALAPGAGQLGEGGSVRLHLGGVSGHPPRVIKPAGNLPVYMNPPAAPVTMGISRLTNQGGE